MPASDNHMYATSRYGHRYPSKDLKAFKYLSKCYELANRKHLDEIKPFLKQPLKVHFDLFFERSKIYCKDGRIKKMDATNRLKALCDAFSEMIGVDDSYFFEVSVAKQVGPQTCVDIRVEIYSIESNL